MNREIKRGDIYLADFDPVRGSEQGGIRPCLVISNNIGNRCGPTVIVAAITSKKKNNQPTHCFLEAVQGLEYKSYVLLEQIRAIDKQRFICYITYLEHEKMEEVEKAIHVALGMNGNDYK